MWKITPISICLEHNCYLVECCPICNRPVKSASYIIQLAKQHQVGTIVFGDIKNIKQKSTLKTFVQIPIQRLSDLTKYKAELEGIKVTKRKENYTSGVSAVDLEAITKEFYRKSRRIKRGLFRSSDGILVNADVNGSLNILRRYNKDQCTPKLIELARDKGYVDAPSKDKGCLASRWKLNNHSPYEASTKTFF